MEKPNHSCQGGGKGRLPFPASLISATQAILPREAKFPRGSHPFTPEILPRPSPGRSGKNGKGLPRRRPPLPPGLI